MFWNIWAKSSSVAPKGWKALVYIFKWALGQPVPSNLSKLGILNLGGALTCRKREREWRFMASSFHRNFWNSCSIWSKGSFNLFSLSVNHGPWTSSFWKVVVSFPLSFWLKVLNSSWSLAWLATKVLKNSWKLVMGSFNVFSSTMATRNEFDKWIWQWAWLTWAGTLKACTFTWLGFYLENCMRTCYIISRKKNWASMASRLQSQAFGLWFIHSIHGSNNYDRLKCWTWTHHGSNNGQTHE